GRSASVSTESFCLVTRLGNSVHHPNAKTVEVYASPHRKDTCRRPHPCEACIEKPEFHDNADGEKLLDARYGHEGGTTLHKAMRVKPEGDWQDWGNRVETMCTLLRGRTFTSCTCLGLTSVRRLLEIPTFRSRTHRLSTSASRRPTPSPGSPFS